MKKFYYKNIFMYSSLQFTGNVEEYFAKHTEKLVVFIVMPRQQYKDNFIRLYKNGKLVEEKQITLSKHMAVYYFMWYVYNLYFIFKYFSRKERFPVITYHPYPMFGMTIHKMFRNLEYVYWKGDYFPPVKLPLIIVEMISRYYDRNLKHVVYLTDLVNKKMNGKIVNTTERKTIMLGIKPRNIKRTTATGRKFSILFVGVIKEAQGVEFLFDFLKTNKDCSVKIIGICGEELYKKYKKIIINSKIEKQVFFPNKFFSDPDLEEISKSCQVGIALYDVGEDSSTYYTDPGKVKTYTSLGLPVIMSDVSAIAPYIKKFNCGVLVKKNNDEIREALLEIKNNYAKYIKGVKDFNKHFYYDTYYKKPFNFLENI